MGLLRMDEITWLLFVPQVPATPSSVRVQLWRHLRAAGAISIQNGVWVLPATPACERLLREERATIIQQGGTGLLFQAHTLDNELVTRFRAERDHEYMEFCERCQALRDELARETAAGKHTFAELEENEHDLAKLERWLVQIQARDFFTAPLAQTAVAACALCQQDLAAFAQVVYAREGVTGAEEAEE